jgi:hypothetical protein
VTDDTVRADARPMPEPPEDEGLIAEKAFERAHARWLKARAALDDPDEPGTDESMRRRMEEESAAVRNFLLLPVPLNRPDLLWWKLDAFTVELERDPRDGARTDAVTVLALGAIKQDLLNLDLVSNNIVRQGREEVR